MLPQIKRSERLVKNPETPKNNFNIPDYKASTKDFDYGYNMEMETMSALQYKPARDSDIKGNMLKAAFGTRLSPVFSYHHYSDLSKTMSLKVGIDHYSTWLDQKDYKKSTFMNSTCPSNTFSSIFHPFYCFTPQNYKILPSQP